MPVTGKGNNPHMTQTEVQEIFLQHIIASLQNDIKYLESLGSNETINAANYLNHAIDQLKKLTNE